MPPRYAYWTILVDNQPTAFRASSQEDLLPTFKRLKEKNPSAVMMWFQNGKLWPSRIDAQEAMRARGEMGRRGDAKQGGGFRDRKNGFGAEGRESRRSAPREGGPRRDERPAWKPKGGGFSPRPKTQDSGPLEWKPKGEFTPSPRRSEKPEWKPKGRGFSPRPKSQDSRPLDWTPKSGYTGPKPEGVSPKRKWIPKEEYKKSQGIEARRDKNWRPGGEHKDPRQKYKDAKKAKWTKFKKQIRSRWEGKKRKDEE